MATIESFLKNNSLIENTSSFIRGGKSITRTRNAKGQFVRGDFERLNIYAIIRQLMDSAKDILYRTYYLVDYENKLGNLIDSTACAVYVDGELVEDSIMYANDYDMSIAPSKVKKQSYAFNSGMKGREAIKEWFENNKHLDTRSNTVQLVVVAAMHYGYYLETGSYGGPEIRVISGIADEFEEDIKLLASKAGYNPTITGISGYSKI